jgi:sec-independent protein translocase protein TatA
MPSIGGPELIIALVIILLLFGAKRIPELAKGLGTGMREFRKGSRGEYEVKDEKEKNEELSASEDKTEARVEDSTTAETDRPETDRAEQKRG